MEQEPDETPFIMKSKPSENQETMDALSLCQRRCDGEGRAGGREGKTMACYALA